MSMTKTPLRLVLVLSTVLGLPCGAALADDVGENEWLLPSPTITASSADTSHVREIPVNPSTNVNVAASNAPVSAPVQVPVAAPAPAPMPVVPVATSAPQFVPTMPGPQIVELKAKYLTKNQVSGYLAHHRYQLVASYAVSGGKPVVMAHLSNVLYYYLNPQSHLIGVAVSKDAAKHLTFANGDVFSARKSETLSETLARWAHDAGYELQWLSAYNYKLQYSYEFVGNLVAADGPLNQILESIAGDNYALKAEVTANRVILIKDNEYSPSILGR